MNDCFRAGNAGHCNSSLCKALCRRECSVNGPLNTKGEPMKQEILCTDCSKEMQHIIGKGAPDEYTRHTPGRALRRFKCDFCGKDIAPLDLCVAFSLWTDTIPLIPGWEKDFILTKGED